MVDSDTSRQTGSDASGRARSVVSGQASLRAEYAEVAGELRQQWGKRNRYEVPRLDKIVVNVGMGQAKDDSAYRDLVVGSLAQITGQRPAIRRARQSIAGFKLREGQEIGAKVTLRGKRMEDFFTRLVHIVLPRVRDFRGLPPDGFDGNGNYTLGISEHTVFPEISYEDVTRTHPLEVTIVTTSPTDDAAAVMLRRLSFPLTGEEPTMVGGKPGQPDARSDKPAGAQRGA